MQNAELVLLNAAGQMHMHRFHFSKATFTHDFGLFGSRSGRYFRLEQSAVPTRCIPLELYAFTSALFILNEILVNLRDSCTFQSYEIENKKRVQTFNA